MRLPGENEEHGSRLSMKYMIIGLSCCILLILGVVLFTNQENAAKKRKAAEQEKAVLALEHEEAVAAQEEQSDGADTSQATYGSTSGMKDIEKLYRENKLTASDLDFWDMYPKNEAESVKTYEEVETEEEGKEEASGETEAKKDKYSKYDEETPEDPADDGKHTLLTYEDGSEEWVLISPYLEKNDYDFAKLTMKADKMAYMEEGKKATYIGVDISKYNGEVDFVSLKEDGIDYAMIRLGARGYGSGQIMLDEKFEENMKKATEAGMDIGIYFFSQAITKDEAIEEANFIIQNLSNYKITYPIAFDMEFVKNDTARIEALSREEKTNIAAAFLDTIKNGGYTPMIYGTKEWLIKQVDLTKLTGYDVWLSQQKDKPDYPYQFQMWQYTLKGGASGISGDVDLNISFVDYSEK